MTRRRRGFTLLELAVALAVGGIAISAGYAALAALVDQRGRIDAATRETSHAFTLRSALAAWLAGAKFEPRGSSGAYLGIDGAHGASDGLPDDQVTFLTAARTPAGDGATIVRLYVARTVTGAPAGLAADFTRPPGAGRQTVILDSTIAGLDVRYAPGLFGRQGWTTAWLASEPLPAGVQLTLYAAPHDSLTPLLRPPIVVTLEGGR